MSAFQQYDEPMSNTGIPVADGVYGDATHIPQLTIVGGVIVKVALIEIVTGGTTPTPTPSDLPILADGDGTLPVDGDGNAIQLG